MTDKQIIDDFLNSLPTAKELGFFEKDINVPSKEIIIDDVDVSGCDRLNAFPMQFGEPHEICLTSFEQWGGQEKYCKDRPNCYYKQLKHKEQECEELKKEKRNFRNFLTNKYNYGSFRPMWGAYLLKRFFKEDLGDFFDEKAYEMANTIEEKEQQLDQLKQALTEIKEIAVGITSTFYKGVEISTTYELLKQILQKCEVLDE